MAARDQTFLFADLAGFTALTEAHGDEQSADLAADFFSAMRELLAVHGGEGGQDDRRCGDGPRHRGGGAAIRLGVGIVREVGAQHGFPSVRVGMHTRPAIERSGDWFGSTVNTAARVSGMAVGGEVLLTDATREAAGHVDGIEFRERGRHELRNLAEPVLLFAAVPQGERAAGELPIDPVCRMAIAPARAAGRLAHEGVEYHFCSLRCVEGRPPPRGIARFAPDTP